MTRTRTEHLIAALSASATPVKRLLPWWVRLVGWLGLSLALVATGAFELGLRRDVWSALGNSAFLLRGAITLLAGLLAAVGAFALSVPGVERGWEPRWLPVAALAAWVTLLATPFVADRGTLFRLVQARLEPECGLHIAELALIPGIVLFALIRRAAPLRCGWAGGLAALAAAAMGATAVQFVCPVNGPAHLLLSHAVPVVLAATGGIAIGRLALVRT